MSNGVNTAVLCETLTIAELQLRIVLLSPQPANISRRLYIDTAIAAARTVTNEELPIENGVRTVFLQIGSLGASNQFVHWRLSQSTGFHLTEVQPIDPNQPSTSQQ